MTIQLAYYEVRRHIDFYFVQQSVESEKFLHGTDEGIRCAVRQFSWKQLHDISYKPFSSGEGLLYLHTHQGMFSYRVKDNPTTFLRFAEERISW